MVKRRGWLVFCLLLTGLKNTYSFGSDWYSYYIQCVATSSQESQCFDGIREFLATEEGKKQASEIGFKRRLYRDSSQISSQSVVISNRISQMQNYLSTALEKATDEKDTVRIYCLSDKSQRISNIRRNAEEIKNKLILQVNQASSEATDGEYQELLSLNSRANEIYLQARKCLD